MNTVYKINPGLPTTTKISNLNDQILSVFGQVDMTQFDKLELDSLYSNLGLIRQYIRNALLGNTLATYAGWTCLSVQTGYNIWKYTPSTYSYNILNAVYWNGALITNMGLATSETATTFNDVTYEGGVLGRHDNTTAAGANITADAFNLLVSTTDYQYFGLSTTFNGIAFTIPQRGSGVTLKVEYYNGSSGTGWKQLTANTNNLVDDTNNLSGNGSITWTAPVDWETDSISGVTSKYLIRISSTTAITTIPTCSYAIPSSSVIGLLDLSSAEVIANEWEFCSYNGNIYATIPNQGNAPSEGNTFITSTSTSANLQNFFIYNNQFTANYASSLYIPSTLSGAVKYTYSFTEASLSSGRYLILTHSAGTQFVHVYIYDNTNTLINPDSIVLTNTTTVTIDLSSFTSISGTWTAIII